MTNKSSALPKEQSKQGDRLSFKRLGEILKTEIQAPKLLVDNVVYRESITSLYAPGGSGKTILALWFALHVMEQGQDVIYCDEENGENRIAELLQHLGAAPDMVQEHLLYRDGLDLSPTPEDIVRWVMTVQYIQPALVIFDPFSDLLAASNMDENSPGDVTRWIKAFAQPVKDIGGAALILDHVMKDDSGKFARGSSAKHAKVDAAWRMSVVEDFNRNSRGKVKIKKDKDRLGSLPERVEFAVGGDGKGNLTVESGDVVKSAGKKTGGLRPAEYKALNLLIPGMARKQWQKRCEDNGIPEGTFKPAVTKLRVRHIFEDNDKRFWPTSQEEDTGYAA